MLRAVILVNAYIRAPAMLRQGRAHRRRAAPARRAGRHRHKTATSPAPVAGEIFPRRQAGLRRRPSTRTSTCPACSKSAASACSTRARRRWRCATTRCSPASPSRGAASASRTPSPPLCATMRIAAVREEFLQAVGQRLGFPLVVKKSFGSWGEGVPPRPRRARARRRGGGI